MLNRIIIGGRMTADAELRTTQGGTSVTSFTIACDRDFKDKESGEKGVDFVEIVAWRATAEFICKYFGKGRAIIVDGRLQVRDWTDKEGNKRRTAEVVADNVYFGDSKRDGDNTGAAPVAAAALGSYGGFAPVAADDGDLPF